MSTDTPLIKKKVQDLKRGSLVNQVYHADFIAILVSRHNN